MRNCWQCPALRSQQRSNVRGNGRIFLVPQVKGAQWQVRAVSTADWTGFPLNALLEKAGLDSNACEILFEACDTGTPKEEPIPPGTLRMPAVCRSVKRRTSSLPIR